MSFEKALAFVLDREGGFSNNKFDRGGATNKGITQKTYDAHRCAIGLLAQSVKRIMPDEVETIYKKQYWDKAKCGLMPEPLDLVLFDSAVQHGPNRAVLFLQRALRVRADGAIGALTLSALKQASIGQVVSAYMDERELFYDVIIHNDPTQARFGKGWANRLALLKQETVLT